MSIFYPDLTYTFSDAIREYDMLLYLEAPCSKSSSRILVPCEDVSGVSEFSKDIVDLLLGSKSLFFTSNRGFYERLYGAALVLDEEVYELLVKGFLDFLGLEAKQLNTAVKWLRRSCSELSNLSYIMQLYVNRDFTSRVLGDWKEYLDVEDGAMEHAEKLTLMCGRYYSSLIALLLGKGTSGDLKQLIVGASKVVVRESMIGLLDYLKPRIGSRKWALIVLPQSIANLKSQRLSSMVKAVENIVRSLGCPGRIVLVSNKFIASMTSEMKRRLEKVVAEVVEYDVDNSRDGIESYVADSDYVIVLILQDYGKNYIVRVLEELVSSRKDFTVVFIPETFYDVSGRELLRESNGKLSVERVMETFSGFGCRDVQKLNLFRVLVLEKTDVEEMTRSITKPSS